MSTPAPRKATRAFRPAAFGLPDHGLQIIFAHSTIRPCSARADCPFLVSIRSPSPFISTRGPQLPPPAVFLFNLTRGTAAALGCAAQFCPRGTPACVPTCSSPRLPHLSGELLIFLITPMSAIPLPIGRVPQPIYRSPAINRSFHPHPVISFIFVANKTTFSNRRLGLPCVTLGWPLRGPWVAQGPPIPIPNPG
jgi:hypothetical protein